MSKRAAPRINSFKFYSHRFKKALQKFRCSGGDTLSAYAKLKQQTNSYLKKVSRSAVGVIALAAAIYTNEQSSTLEIKTSFFSIKIPILYLMFSFSIAWMSFCFNVQSWIQNLLFKNVFSRFFGSFKNDFEMLTFLEGVDVDDFLAPPFFDRFLFPSKTAFSLRFLTIPFLIISLLLPTLCAFGLVLTDCFNLLVSGSDAPLSTPIIFCTVVLLIAPAVHLATAFIPFKTNRNTRSIRFGFLSPIHSRSSKAPHPEISRWLSEENRDN